MCELETCNLKLETRTYRRLALAWGILLLALTSWPSPPEVPVISAIPDFDKLTHALLYGIEGFLVFRAVDWPAESRSPWLRALAVAGALAVWATLDEIHQHWIPGRAMEGLDMLADTFGGFVGALWAGRRAGHSP
jgi:VanZ family protein